jgi:outer membrane protein insertion porin family
VLEEGERASAGYLFTYNDDKGSRGELDGELRHLARVGLSAGGRASLGPDIRDGRGFIHVPPLFPPGKLTVSGFRLAEDLPLDPAQPEGETFERVQVGAQLQATRRFGDRWDVLWGYRFKRTTIVSPFATISLKVAALDVSLVRDTRDNPIDARRGRFWSLSLELAPKKLGSDFDFVKGYAQAFVSRPLGPTFTWAQGLRLGLAHPFGGEPLVSDEGFEAGGANSIRGFDPGEVGPVDYRFGREGVLVVNEELRYHHPSGLGGVVFYDAGNTFATAEDFSLDLRHVLGAGVRWRSPVGLLRVDLGRPLGRLREGESRYKLFFSFGQAF